MPASMFASVLTFILTGTFAINRAILHGVTWHADNSTKTLVLAILGLQAIYFFYVEVCTEANEEVRQRLRQCGLSEWWLRVLAQVELVSLWILLGYGLDLFLLGVICLNITYLLWNMATWECSPDPKHKLAWIDLSGFLCATATYLIAGSKLAHPEIFSESLMLVLGMSLLGFILQLAAGLILIRYPARNFWANCS